MICARKVNQEESEQDEVDEMKKGVDSTGKVMEHRSLMNTLAAYKLNR